MNVHFSKRFLKSAKALSQKDQQRLTGRIEWFRVDPFDPRLKTHALTGRLQGIWSFSLTYKYRVTYVLADPNTAVFMDVGSHNKVY